MNKAQQAARIIELEKIEMFCRRFHGNKQDSTICPGIKYPDAVGREFDAFIRLISIDAGTGFGHSGNALDNRFYDGGRPDKPLRVPFSDDVREQFTYFYAKVREAVRNQEKAAYNAGVEYGRQLLGQLAKGEISISDFDAVSSGEIPRRKR